jgi:hypothetical protein
MTSIASLSPTNKLFLLRIVKCELGGMLAPNAYLDMVGLSKGEARARILAELKKRAGEDLRPKE